MFQRTTFRLAAKFEGVAPMIKAVFNLPNQVGARPLVHSPDCQLWHPSGFQGPVQRHHCRRASAASANADPCARPQCRTQRRRSKAIRRDQGREILAVDACSRCKATREVLARLEYRNMILAYADKVGIRPPEGGCGLLVYLRGLRGASAVSTSMPFASRANSGEHVALRLRRSGA